MKQTRITILHEAEKLNQSDIQSACNWLLEQMSAADLVKCNHLSASIQLNESTSIDFNMIDSELTPPDSSNATQS